MIKKLFCMILAAVGICMFTGCGKTVVSASAGGVPVRIEAEKAGALSRLPHFENKEGRMVMTHSGNTWYAAAILSKKEASDRFSERIPCAVSSNIAVYKYRHDHPDFFAPVGYSYLMTLDGTEEAYICFDSDSAPDAGDLGTDFASLLRYYAGNTETVPDTVFILTED